MSGMCQVPQEQGQEEGDIGCTCMRVCLRQQLYSTKRRIQEESRTGNDSLYRLRPDDLNTNHSFF